MSTLTNLGSKNALKNGMFYWRHLEFEFLSLRFTIKELFLCDVIYLTTPIMRNSITFDILMFL